MIFKFEITFSFLKKKKVIFKKMQQESTKYLTVEYSSAAIKCKVHDLINLLFIFIF